MAKVCIIDDDYLLAILAENLGFRGHDVTRYSSAAQAIQNLPHIRSSRLVILDVIMQWPESFPSGENASGGRSTGMYIYKELRSRDADLAIIVFSAIQDKDLIAVIAADKKARFLSKYNSHSMEEIASLVEDMAGGGSVPVGPLAFIVHGHDEVNKLGLKNYLQNIVGLPEPIILHEQPNSGRSIVEQFEDYAARSTVAFVLLTPDDRIAEGHQGNDALRRARQNVIFEMGYMMGVFGRRSGRVILLHKGPLDLPSDLSGVVYIDISNGIEAAGEQIRRELQNVSK
ncbi:MAG: nucleotide-binding protein [Chloroflexi bacterium]|nr:nucleotide-binding protein [Chloroflexota bacterium]